MVLNGEDGRPYYVPIRPKREVTRLIIQLVTDYYLKPTKKHGYIGDKGHGIGLLTTPIADLLTQVEEMQQQQSRMKLREVMSPSCDAAHTVVDGSYDERCARLSTVDTSLTKTNPTPG